MIENIFLYFYFMILYIYYMLFPYRLPDRDIDTEKYDDL